MAIGCHGTDVHVGKLGSIIRLIEERFKKPFAGMICLQHTSELSFQYSFSFVTKHLSTDQLYLYRIVTADTSGEFH